MVKSQLLDAKQFRNVDPRLHSILNEIEESPIKQISPGKELPVRLKGSTSFRTKQGLETFGVIIHTDAPAAIRSEGIHPNSILSDRLTARITLDQIRMLSLNAAVRYIELSGVSFPHNDVAAGLTGAALLHDGYLESTPYKGAGVIVGIYDTGIDWTHLDFRDPGDTTASRIISIWDQTLDSLTGDVRPSGFDYGVEYTTSDIEDEVDGSPAGFVRETDSNGHGTHVAGTAAGNGASLSTRKYAGMAPEADILVVKGGNSSFSDANIVDGLTWFESQATALGKPIVVNMSLGSDAGPHDGTGSKESAMNAFADVGRVVVVSAGNSGSSDIHISGSIGQDDSIDFSFDIPSYTPSSGAGNDDITFEMWFSGSESVNATVISPNGDTVVQTAGGDVDTSVGDGSVFVFNYVDGDNGDRQVVVYCYDADANNTPEAGTWTVRLNNVSGSSVTVHGWMYDRSIGDGAATLTGADTDYTLGNSASEAIIVGSYVSRFRWRSAAGVNQLYGGTNLSDDLSSFSSRGPTRSGGQKPDIAAPGQGIISCVSSEASYTASDVIVSATYVKSQGTSMSSPVVAGLAALMLQRDNGLSASQVESLLESTAEADTYSGGTLPNYDWGYGKVNVFLAMQKLIDADFPRAWKMHAYDEWSGDAGVTTSASGNDYRIAVRFTPSTSGHVIGAFFHTSQSKSLSDSITIEVWSDDGSELPNTILGSATSVGDSSVSLHSWNFASMAAAPISVNSGTDYHLVLTIKNGSSMSMRIDNDSVDGRSSVSTSGSWSSYANDWRLRPIVSNDVSSLPVQMAGLSARMEEGAVVLRWSTVTEVDNAGWEIERSSQSTVNSRQTGAEGWVKIGFVEGAGTSSSPREYSFEDHLQSAQRRAQSDGNQLSVSERSALSASRLAYRLKQLDRSGSFSYSEVVEVSLANTAPRVFHLSQNFPNPFNPATTIFYTLESDGPVTLKVYDLIGREVATLVNGQQRAGVLQSVSFDGKGLASGLYITRLTAGGRHMMRRIVLLK